MSVSGVNSVLGNQAATAASASNASRVPTKLLNQDDFLKLVVAQMTHQDPLAPQTDTEFISQMTTFTTLEQTKTMQADISQMRAQQNILKGMSLMDREVVVKSGASGGTTTGVVKGMDMQDGQNIKIVVGDKSYALSDVVEVHLAN